MRSPEAVRVVVLASLALAVVGASPRPTAGQEPETGRLLLLNRFHFDPLVGEPTLPPDQTTSYAPGEQGFHLVQFVGPTQDEWLERLRATGVVVIQFQPTHAYIVRMTPEQAAAVAQESFVRAVNIYHAAYRIAPSVLRPVIPGPEAGALANPVGTIANVAVTIFDDGHPGGSVDRTIQEIQSLGGSLVDREKAQAADPLVTAIFVLPEAAVTPVAQLNNALWLNFRPPVEELEDESSDQITAGNVTPLGPGYQAWLATQGLTGGGGVTVALVDSGYDTGNNATAHPDLQGRLIPVGAPIDTNGHGTHVGGIIAGNATLGTLDASNFLFGLGVAPSANLVVRLNTGPDPDRTMDAVTNGAVASNHSYALHAAGAGYDSRDRTHDFLVRDADQTTAAVEPLIIVFSAGNSGAAGPTKEAKNIIAVANSLSQRDGAGNPLAGTGNINTLAGTSSRGPAQDGRTYPHVAAPGTNIVSTRSTQAGLVNCTLIAAGAPAMNPTYSMCSGTSMAAPHATGSVAVITEWWRGFNAGANPSPAMAKALLINGAVDMGAADIPNNNEGWGRVNLSNVISSPTPAIYVDQTTTFGATGDTLSLQVSPVDPTQALRVTLAWSDAPGPGSGGATAAWVNDLDLRVVEGATASTFLGNVFVGGFSVPGGVADTQNNVENVYIQNPSGPYELTIAASNIAGDGVPGNADLTDQDFAFVCSNCEPNQAPICDANGPYQEECAGPSTSVTLDGSGSFDPNGNPLSFTWTGAFLGGIAVGTAPTVQFPGTGAFSVTLEVSDGLAADQCNADVTIVDTTAPVVSCSLAQAILHPANHGLVNVGFTGTATDVCSGPLPVSVAVFSDEDDEEPTGAGNHSPDGKIDPELRLRAERRGDANGRVYLVVVTSADPAGNVGHDCCTAVVPHGQNGGALAAVNAQADAARSFCLANGGPPPGFFAIGDGPIVGPKQ